jgi:hypothetical protein
MGSAAVSAALFGVPLKTPSPPKAKLKRKVCAMNISLPERPKRQTDRFCPRLIHLIAAIFLPPFYRPRKSLLTRSRLLYLEAENLRRTKCSLFRRKYLISHFPPHLLRSSAPLPSQLCTPESLRSPRLRVQIPELPTSPGTSITLTCQGTLLSCQLTCPRAQRHNNNVPFRRNSFQTKIPRTRKHVPAQNGENNVSGHNTASSGRLGLLLVPPNQCTAKEKISVSLSVPSCSKPRPFLIRVNSRQFAFICGCFACARLLELQ